ncbi:MAG: hypothetical protein E6J42_07495 [Chloroflexi bacterium]|nr:MAG: hypothetical protein E6J42_07495 [Chloroflexota bacterium]
MPLTLRIDPWEPSYDSALKLDDTRTPARPVDLFVETEVWEPVQPAPMPRPDTIVFVDGVQRVETRVIGEDDGRLVYGAFVSVGIGAAVVREGGSRLEPETARRIVALGDGERCDPFDVACGSASLRFEPESEPEKGPEGWHGAVDRVRRDGETKLGQQMIQKGHELVIADGRLTFQPTRKSHAVGVAKSIRTVYLERPYSTVLGDLRPGTRTPVFEIAYEHPVYSWYVRLSSPRIIEHPLAGIVQVETMAGIGREEAIRLADLTAQHLPAFASDSAWDGRAPQNLYPIAALESLLRHELGDHEWIRRHIEVHFHRQGAGV